MLGMGKRRLDMFFSPYPEQLFISPVLGLSSSTSVTSVAVHEWRWGFLACLVCGDLWGMVACCSWVTAESKEIPHKKIVLLSLLQNECVKYCCKLLGYVCLDSQLWLTTWIVQQQEQQRIQRRICSFAIKTALALSSDGRCEEHTAVYQCKHQYIHTFSAGIGVMETHVMDTSQGEEKGIGPPFYLMGKSEDVQKFGIFNVSDRLVGFVPQRSKLLTGDIATGLFIRLSCTAVCDLALIFNRKQSLDLNDFASTCMK